MKSFVCIILLTLLLGGCARQEQEAHIEEKSTMQERVFVTEVQTTEEIEIVEEEAPSIANDDSKDDGWLTYAEKYNTEHRFADLYVPAKYWLVGKENIVEIISVGGIDDVTVMEHKTVERVEQLNVDEFTNISVFDKTGKSISIMVSLEDAGKLLDLIEQN